MEQKHTENEAVKTVNIPLDEYFELRQKADSAMFLMTELGEMRVRFENFERRLYDLERRVYERT